MSDIKEFYERNADFRRFVDRHARQYSLTLEQALSHAVVRNTAEYYENAEKSKINVSEIKVGCGCVDLEDKSC